LIEKRSGEGNARRGIARQQKARNKQTQDITREIEKRTIATRERA